MDQSNNRPPMPRPFRYLPGDVVIRQEYGADSTVLRGHEATKYLREIVVTESQRGILVKKDLHGGLRS